MDASFLYSQTGNRIPSSSPSSPPVPNLRNVPTKKYAKPPRTWGNAIADAANTGMDIVDAGLTLGDAGARYTWGAADQAFNVAGGKPIKYGSVNPFDEKMGMQFSDFMANRGLWPQNDTSNWEARDIPAGVADMVMDPMWLAPPLKAGKLAGQAFKGLRGGYNAARAMMR